MEVLNHFDGGVPRPFQISGDTITFNLSKCGTLHVLVRGAPAEFGVKVTVEERPGMPLVNQGLLYSHDGRRYKATPAVESESSTYFSYRVPGGDGMVWISTRIPYGRDNLDRLLADCTCLPNLSVRTLEGRGRIVPVFEFGEEGEGKRVHWFVAGEDAWEAAGSWVADAMIRALASNRSLAEKLLANSVLRIVPMTSPYSATQPGSSHTTIDGEEIYGAATWSDDEPPTEFALVREEVLKDVKTGRLGLLLNIHSWNGSYVTTTMEFIRTAGDRELTGRRLGWAKRTLETLMIDVPLGTTKVSEKIWHPGLARDYMLARHDVAAFRIEVTTAGQSYDEFAETGLRLLANCSGIGDWSGVLPEEGDA